MKFSDLLITFVLLIGSWVLFPFLDWNRAEFLNEMEYGSKWSLLQFKPVLLPYVHLHLLFTSSTIMISIVMPSKENIIREKINTTMKQRVGVCRGYCFADVRPSGAVHELY